MGVYDSGIIYGIRMYVFDDDEFLNILYEKFTYDQIMNEEEKKQAYLFYRDLKNKDNIRIQYYTKCSSSYGDRISLNWFPMSLETFIAHCGI